MLTRSDHLHCEDKGYRYRVAKNTNTTGRVFIDYGNIGTPLKVEVSYRRKIIPDESVTYINGIKVYTLNEICRLKAAAYMGRDAIRDLYDISFICSEYFDKLSNEARRMLQSAFEYKDIEQFDYLVATQDDSLIDKDLLETRFLDSFDKVGLLTPERPEKSESKVQDPLGQISLEDAMVEATLSQRAHSGQSAADLPRDPGIER